MSSPQSSRLHRRYHRLVAGVWPRAAGSCVWLGASRTLAALVARQRGTPMHGDAAQQQRPSLETTWLTSATTAATLGVGSKSTAPFSKVRERGAFLGQRYQFQWYTRFSLLRSSDDDSLSVHRDGPKAPLILYRNVWRMHNTKAKRLLHPFVFFHAFALARHLAMQFELLGRGTLVKSHFYAPMR